MGELRGHQWQPREIARFCYDAGWQDAQTLVVAVAVCLAESQGYDRAVNTNPDGSVDRGLWQLNSIHKDIPDEVAYDAKKATAAAFNLWASRRSDFSDWAAYQSGVYKRDSYLGRAVQGVGNYLGEEMLSWPVEPKADGSPYVHRFTTPVLNFQHRLGGAVHHIELAERALGWQAASRDRVLAVRNELAKARVAAKQPLPN